LQLPVTGSGTLVEARVCKSRGKADTRENDAGLVGEALIFLEIEMHRQLLLKLKLMGMNAAFSLRTQVHVGQDLIVGLASATAVHTPALPPPALLKIKRSLAVVDKEDEAMLNLQRRIESVAGENRERMLRLAMRESEEIRAAIRTARAHQSRLLDERNAAANLKMLHERVAASAAAKARGMFWKFLDEEEETGRITETAPAPDAPCSSGAGAAAAATEDVPVLTVWSGGGGGRPGRPIDDEARRCFPLLLLLLMFVEEEREDGRREDAGLSASRSSPLPNSSSCFPSLPSSSSSPSRSSSAAASSSSSASSPPSSSSSPSPSS
jgi:hypothetical protein